MARVELLGVEKRFADGTHAVRPLDLQVEDGEMVVLVGPSGCGKTTLLRMIAGLEGVSGGDIRFDGRSVLTSTPRERNVAMVFQSYALYPHMSVRANLEFPLRMAGWNRRDRAGRVEATASMLGLEGHLHRKPGQLSGGQRQRVAMGRALVREPAVLLMDEPLSNLDAKLRVEIRSEIAALVRRAGTTTVYVTHDQAEAMTLGDRIAVLHDGVLQQQGAPQALYERPANAFVATFLGHPGMNLAAIDRGADGELRLAGRRVSLGSPPAEAVRLGVRPEHLRAGEPEPSGAVLEGEVVGVEVLGHEQWVHLRLRADADLVWIARGPASRRFEIGRKVSLAFDEEAVWWFDAAGQAIP